MSLRGVDHAPRHLIDTDTNKENTMIDPRDVISALFAVVATYFWYDKTKVDKTLEDYKDRLRKLENKQSVLETKLDGIREMLDVKFDMVMKALERRD
jgi:hypothetical protein